MKKIMFNNRYGLEEAVVERCKTKTRRNTPKSLPETIRKGYDRLEIFNGKELRCYKVDGSFIKYKLPYQVGEVVAVAQCYKDIACGALWDDLKEAYRTEPAKLAGWTNKMFVRADLMPHRICITSVRVERLQDISDEDCIKEGVIKGRVGSEDTHLMAAYYVPNMPLEPHVLPQGAYAALIDRISGEGTWESNPWVFVYDFELVK